MKSFGVAKFKSLLFAGSFTVLANYIIDLSDSVISGHLLGPSALAGVGLSASITATVAFLSGLISSGTATNYSLAMGRLDRTRARQFFTQGVLSALGIGLAFALAIGFGKDAFLSFMGPSAEIFGHARAYLTWYAPVPMAECLEMTLVLLVCGDGGPKLCVGAYVAKIVVNLVAGVFAVRAGMGTAGCALATVLADVTSLLILSSHFFQRCNTLSLVRHFSLRDTARIAGASFGDAAAFLCDALLFFFLGKFVILVFGSEALPVVAVVIALWGFLELFNGVGYAIQPIVTVYFGERNTRAVRDVMASAMKVAFAEGVGLAVVFLVFPQLAARLVGIDDPATVARAGHAVRSMCCGFVALAFAGLFNSYYMFIERSGLAGVITFLCYLVFPVACVATGAIFGLSGVWLGLGLGPFVGLIAVAVFIFSADGRAMFPLLLPRDRDERLHVFGLRLTPEAIVETSRKIGAIVGVPMRAALMAEEVFMVVLERNRHRSVLGEVTVDLNDGVRMTLRDDGEIFDITDADAKVSSLRTFLVASVMERQANRANLVTTGFNRNVFSF